MNMAVALHPPASSSLFPSISPLHYHHPTISLPPPPAAAAAAASSSFSSSSSTAFLHSSSSSSFYSCCCCFSSSSCCSRDGLRQQFRVHASASISGRSSSSSSSAGRVVVAASATCFCRCLWGRPLPRGLVVGGLSNFALDAAVKPILYENGEEELQPQQPPTIVSAPDRRIVAIGDLHGDFERTLWALQLAGVLSKDGLYRWIGGTTVLVQVGDVLDRGEDEIAILSLLAWLGKQARSNGGSVFQINGNHETMNVAGDFRNVTPGGFKEAEAFADCCEEDYGGNWEAAFGEWYATSQEKKADQGFSFGNWLPIFNYLRLQKGIAARSLLFEAGGPMAKQLARHGVALKVNDWLFAHGGIMPHHVEYGLERMNHEVSLWMKNANNRWGQPAQIPFFAIKGYDSVVWSRLYSHERYENPEEKIQPCAILSAALVAAKARGLVVGHTPQTIGANCKCDGRVWRIDVGMSSGVLHALPEVRSSNPYPQIC
ncbi:hypothetical protein CY35_08G084400 [Sphagnum magellanicum]|nr:hypothetical protein CY35_08G084400 [Sphagnum magellanicum]